MLAILSPAKDMAKSQFAENQYKDLVKIPAYVDIAQTLVDNLSKYSIEKIKERMMVSDKLAETNFLRLKQWDKKHTGSNSTPAIVAFTGEAYRGLNARQFSKKEFVYSQKVLRILSGLYGVLSPLDLIQPYRLEMGYKFQVEQYKNLYSLWSNIITKHIENDVFNSPGDKVLINIASNEYFKVIDKKRFSAPIIHVQFLDERNGKARVVTVYAKKARGMFARFIIENKIEKTEDLQAFDSEGYVFNARRSDKNTLVFSLM